MKRIILVYGFDNKFQGNLIQSRFKLWFPNGCYGKCCIRSM